MKMKAQDLHLKLAERVRADSKYLTELTNANALATVQSGMADSDVVSNLAEIAANDDTFVDIKSVQGPTGKVYYYSEKYMTATYARILARVKAEDPCLTIAETVREESRVYPRVTGVELFKYGLFKIDHDRLDEYVARVLELNADIQSVRSKSGALYLYSTQYITPEWAAYLAKRAETVDS